MEQINFEINKLEIKIRNKIDEFDKKQDLKFENIYKNITKLWTKRNQLIIKLNEQIANIEQNDLIQLNKIIEFNRKKKDNSTFLNNFLKFVDELEVIHRLLNECVQHDQEKQYDQFVTKICIIDNSIHQLQENLQKNCFTFNNQMYDIFSKEINSILQKMNFDRDNLTKKVNYDLKHIWDENLCIKSEEENEKLIINIYCKFRNKTDQLNEYLIALNKNYLLEHLIKNFGKKVIDTILQTILNKEYSLDDFEISSVDNTDTLVIRFLNQSTELYNGELIFQCIETLIRFLQMIFESNQLVLQLLNTTFKQIFKILNENVLNELLPSKEHELPNYTNYVKQVEDLQESAIAACCLKKEDALNFSNLINLNFVNKLCYQYLIKGRKIVKKDLFPTKEIGTNYLIKNSLNTDFDINQTLYSFPKCRISVSVNEFVEVLKEIINEINSNDNKHRKDLLVTLRKLCELYIDVSIIKHQKRIDESFVSAAIFHNNCFYLAHELVKLSNKINFTEQYSIEATLEEKISPKSLEKYETYQNSKCWDLNENTDFDTELIDKPTNDILEDETAESNKIKINMPFNLIDFVPLLRDVGSEYLLNQMKLQRQFVLNTLQESKIMQNFSNDQNIYKDHFDHPLLKAINQILDKVFNLREEILLILPTSVTIRIISTFLNTLIQELFHTILKIEDIPECNCNILLSAFNYLETYLNDKEKEQRWTEILDDYHKLLEMKFILKANLQEIEDRWIKNEGLLTRAFTPDQLKHMIRALFQNTERRSVLLFKIK